VEWGISLHKIVEVIVLEIAWQLSAGIDLVSVPSPPWLNILRYIFPFSPPVIHVVFSLSLRQLSILANVQNRGLNGMRRISRSMEFSTLN
jgi:hypothetical protein